ncbi:MAG TPA: hypothetical protein VH641_02570 [Streptosporangiaceae bacterium]
MSRRARSIAGAAGLAALLAAAGCGSTAPARPAATAVTVPAVPLDTTIANAAGTWATVVMGGSAAQYNNFWQLFMRPAGATQWKLVTPPGTADNGGLVLAGSTGQALITAFRPSQDLTYTPLTATSDAGRTWSAISPLDAPLASTPDSLAAQPGTGRLLALLTSGTTEQAAAAGATWTTLVTARALAATSTGRSCGLRALTAVAYTPAGAPLLAGACSRPGVAGIFEAAGHTWQTAGPSLSGALARQPVTVLRLNTSGSQVAALLAAGTGQHAIIVAAWSANGGTRWTLSPPLTTSGQAITAASFGPGQTAAIITAGGHAAALAAGRWQQLPALPAGTAALAPAADGTTSALAVLKATLTVWQLASLGGSWTRTQVINVPIQYGSSG